MISEYLSKYYTVSHEIHEAYNISYKVNKAGVYNISITADKYRICYTSH